MSSDNYKNWSKLILNRHLIFQFEILCQNSQSHVEKDYLTANINWHVFLQKRSILKFVVLFFLHFLGKYFVWFIYFLRNCSNGQWCIQNIIHANMLTRIDETYVGTYFLAEKHNCHLHRTTYSISNDTCLVFALHILAVIFMY